MIKDLLDRKFLSIMRKHNNPIWTIQELEYLIYDKHRSLYLKLPEDYKQDVDDYMDALRKIYGGE